MARNKHPEQTVTRILDTASAHFFQKGYDKTTLQDIIDATKLSKGAIYHHFVSKEAILIAVADRMGEYNTAVLAEVRDKKGLTGAEKLREMLRTAMRLTFQSGIVHMLPFLIENPKFMALQMESILNEAAPHYALPVLREGIADGSIRTQYPKELAELMTLLPNLWLAPSVIPGTREELFRRFCCLGEMLEHMGMPLFNEEILALGERFFQGLEEKNS